MTRTIDGRKYLMRDQRSVTALRQLHLAYCKKYGDTPLHRWLVECGKVYVEIKPREVRDGSVLWRGSDLDLAHRLRLRREAT